MTINVTDTVGANNTIVLDSNSKMPTIDSSQVTALNASAFTTGIVPVARIDVGTSANQILQLDGNAKIPAIDGSNLTNAPGPTVSTSDPTISSNLTLGAKWINKTSGEVYICTDATAGANVWTNVGEGTGDIQPFAFQGTQYGFCMAGNHPTRNNIQKYSYTADANGTDVADLTYSAQGPQGGRSQTYGYCAGGEPSLNVINKFSFTDGNNATDIGNLTLGRAMWGGHGASSGDAVYWHGGEYGSSKSNVIDKRVTASDGDATDVGDLTAERYGAAGASSDTYGYAMGGAGNPWPTYHNVVERYAFASDGNSVDTTQDLLATNNNPFSSNSTTNIYVSGGYVSGGYSQDITKFAINSSANATDIGNLSAGGTGNGAGSSSTTYGYCHGGYPSYRTVIEKFSFSTDGNATDVGDLAQGVSNMAGSQH